MTDLGPITKGVIPGATLPPAAAVAGAPVILVIALAVLVLAAFYAWRIFENPELVERWAEIGERRRERRRR